MPETLRGVHLLLGAAEVAARRERDGQIVVFENAREEVGPTKLVGRELECSLVGSDGSFVLLVRMEDEAKVPPGFVRCRRFLDGLARFLDLSSHLRLCAKSLLRRLHGESDDSNEGGHVHETVTVLFAPAVSEDSSEDHPGTRRLPLELRGHPLRSRSSSQPR